MLVSAVTNSTENLLLLHPSLSFTFLFFKKILRLFEIGRRRLFHIIVLLKGFFPLSFTAIFVFARCDCIPSDVHKTR